jgi:hypothetical protein
MGLIFRSCEVVNYPKKHTTSLIGNNNLTKNSRSYRGRHISNNIMLISEVLQRSYKLFKLFIYKVCNPTSEKVLEVVKRLRVWLIVVEQDYTLQLAACSQQRLDD